MTWLFSRALIQECGNWRSLQERVEASSPGTCLDGEPSAQLSVMPTPHKFWRNDKTMEPSALSRFGLTCAVLTADHGEDLLTWYLEDFLARTSALPETVPVLKDSGPASGESLRGSFAKWDRVSCTWKTAQLSLLADSETFSETWPRSGLMRDGVCYLRPTAARPISASESGLWQTPVADDAVERTDGKWNSRGEPKLSAEAKLWPTPTATLASNGGRVTPRKGREGGTLTEAVSARIWPTPTVCGNYNRKGASATSGDGLATAVKTWPTPCASASASKGSSPAALTRKTGKSRANDRIDHAVMSSDGGQLNPEWVEWLMGWPIGHTGLEPLETARFLEWQQQHGRS